MDELLLRIFHPLYKRLHTSSQAPQIQSTKVHLEQAKRSSTQIKESNLEETVELSGMESRTIDNVNNK